LLLVALEDKGLPLPSATRRFTGGDGHIIAGGVDRRPPRNRLLPRYINIATTRYNKLLGPQHKQAQKKKERKRKENNAETGRLTKTKMTRNCCVHRRIPTTLLAL
jgi:hypothetical protein